MKMDENFIVGNKCCYHFRKVFIDILPNIGTYPSVDILLERMEKGDIPKDTCPLAMMSLSLLPRPDVFMVKRLMVSSQKHPTLYRHFTCLNSVLPTTVFYSSYKLNSHAHSYYKPSSVSLQVS